MPLPASIRRRAAFACDGHRYANVEDGRMGIAFIDAAVKSSQNGATCMGWIREFRQLRVAAWR